MEPNKIPELPPPTSISTEGSEVERPFLLQLAGMGRQYLPGDIDMSKLTERENFRMFPRLRKESNEPRK